MEILKQTLLNYIPSKSRSTGKCVSFNCPCCVYMGESRPDTKGRGGLFIEYDTIGYNCFNCRFKFRQEKGQRLGFKVKKFMELLGVPSSEINRAQLESLKSSSVAYNLLGLDVTTKSKPKLDLDFKKVELPSGTKLINDEILKNDSKDLIDVYNYAVDRGVENHPYIMWSPYKDNKLNRRLIIPFMHEGNIVGYTARMIDKCKKEDRYITRSPNSSKYVFNIDSIFKQRKYLLVNESPIDSILYDGIATMNFEPTYNQIQLINEFNGTVIVIPDFGSGGMKMIDTAVKNNWSVFFPDWNDNFDLGEATQMYGKLFVVDRIISEKIDNPVKIEVMKRIFKEKYT